MKEGLGRNERNKRRNEETRETQAGRRESLGRSRKKHKEQ